MKGRNQKILFFTLVVLTAAFVLTKLFRRPARESNLDVSSLKVDTAQVTEVKLYPLVEHVSEIKLVRQTKGWKVMRETKTFGAEDYPVNTMLQLLASLRPQRIVTRREEKWNDYQVGDTTGVQVKVFHDDTLLATLWIGRESDGNTYVRRDDRDEVYAVTGSLLGSFNRKFNDWRDKTFLRLNPDSITVVDFRYPADSGFVLKKNMAGWTAGEAWADSIKVASYLTRLRAKNIYSFADNFVPAAEPQFLIQFISAQKPATIIKAWKTYDDQFIMTSSLQEGVFFSGNPATMREMFLSKNAVYP